MDEKVYPLCHFRDAELLRAITRASNCHGDYAEKWPTSDIFILYLQFPVLRYCLKFTHTARLTLWFAYVYWKNWKLSERFHVMLIKHTNKSFVNFCSLALLQASVATQMKSALFWDLTHDTIFSSATNKIQSYTIYLFLWNALHVSGGSSAHHQEFKTVYTASGTL